MHLVEIYTILLFLPTGCCIIKEIINEVILMDTFHTKVKKFFKNFITIGIICILISLLISLGIIPIIPNDTNSDMNGAWNILRLGLQIISAALSSVGVSFIISYVMDIKKNTPEYQENIKNYIKDIYNSNVSPLISKSLSDFICNPETISQLSTEAKLTLINNCITQKNDIDQYNKQVITSIFYDDRGYRRDASCVGKAYVKEGIVYLDVTLQYKQVRLKDEFEPELTYTDSEDNKILYIKFSNPNNSNDSETITAEQLEINQTPAHGTHLECVNQLPVPAKFADLTEILVQKMITFKGFNHWINFGWLHLYATQGFTFSISCFDDLIIKESMIFDDSKTYLISPTSEDMFNASTTQWVAPNTGMFVTIADKNTNTDTDNIKAKK